MDKRAKAIEILKLVEECKRLLSPMLRAFAKDTSSILFMQVRSILNVLHDANFDAFNEQGTLVDLSNRIKELNFVKETLNSFIASESE